MSFADAHFSRCCRSAVSTGARFRGSDPVQSVGMGNRRNYLALRVQYLAHPFVEIYLIACLVESAYGNECKCHIGCMNSILKCHVRRLWPIRQFHFEVSHPNGLQLASIGCGNATIDRFVVGK